MRAGPLKSENLAAPILSLGRRRFMSCAFAGSDRVESCRRRRAPLLQPLAPAAKAMVAREGAHMKPVMVVGIVLMIVGVIALAYEGITYTTREKVVDIGPLKATVEKKKTIPLPPVLGGLALVGGVVLVIAGSRR
jgi:hypothetical protein